MNFVMVDVVGGVVIVIPVPIAFEQPQPRRWRAEHQFSFSPRSAQNQAHTDAHVAATISPSRRHATITLSAWRSERRRSGNRPTGKPST